MATDECGPKATLVKEEWLQFQAVKASLSSLLPISGQKPCRLSIFAHHLFADTDGNESPHLVGPHAL